MQKALKGIRAVAGRVLFIGFSIQIVLGLGWMVCNFMSFQQFGDTLVYGKIGETLICDEYEGILYPVLIVMAKGIEGLLLIPYHYFLYLLQIVFALFSACTLLHAVGIKGKFWTAWGSLVFLTFPMTMQCHLAVLPDSFVCSLLLLEIAFVVEVFLKREQPRFGQFAKALACWAGLALLLPNFLFIGVVPVLFLFLYAFGKAWKRDKKRILYYGILVLAFAGIISGVNGLTQVEGYYGRTHKSVQATIVSRCAWLYIGYNYGRLPEEVKEHLTSGDALRVTSYAENVDQVLGRKLEAAVGVERAKELFLEIAGQAWQNEKKTILHNTAWDVVGYTVSPIVVQRQFSGKAYDSYSGRNYDIMRSETPVLTKYYMDYGCWWFVVGLALTATVQLISLMVHFVTKGQEATARKKGIVPSIFLCMFTSAVLVILYTLRGAGMMDYKKSIAVTLLWILWMLLVCIRGVSEKQEA